MLDILIAILATIGGLIVLAVVAMLTAYFLLSRRLTIKLRQTVEEMQSMLAQSHAVRSQNSRAELSNPSGIPPMRIHLRPIETVSWRDRSLADRIERWLLAHSFDKAGDFYIPEMESEFLRVYLSQDQYLVAATRYQADGTEPYVEFCFDLGDAVRGGVSNPPGAPIPLPPAAVGAYLHGQLSQDFELLSRMWLQAKELVDTHHVHPVSKSEITSFFEVAHAAQMDSRIAHGGITEQEIRSSLTAQGADVCESDIAEIQKQWQAAIERHLLEYSRRGRNEIHSGREILIVYDGSQSSYLHDRIRQLFENAKDTDQELVRSMVAELKILLRTFSPRDAMARFRPLLPESLRYELIDQIQEPTAADLYGL